MNSLTENEFPGMHNLRDQLLDFLTDQDLAYKLPGDNPTLGELCVEIGQTQQIYTNSFKVFKQNWNYRDSQPQTPNSVEGLRVWYKKLENEMEAALNTLSEDDVQHKEIDRGHGFIASPAIQFMVYHEAVLIFYAKASVYLKALGKQLTDDWKVAIG